MSPLATCLYVCVVFVCPGSPGVFEPAAFIIGSSAAYSAVCGSNLKPHVTRRNPKVRVGVVGRYM